MFSELGEHAKHQEALCFTRLSSWQHPPPAVSLGTMTGEGIWVLSRCVTYTGCDMALLSPEVHSRESSNYHGRGESAGTAVSLLGVVHKGCIASWGGFASFMWLKGKHWHLDWSGVLWLYLWSLCACLDFLLSGEEGRLFGLNSENHKNVSELWVIMVMFEEPDMRIYVSSACIRIRWATVVRHLNMVLSADYIKIQMKPTYCTDTLGM